MDVLAVRNLGRRPYEPTWRAMREWTERRDRSTADELWLVEHDPVFTLGRAGDSGHVIDAGDIPVVRTDRGGQVTYHGPGQLVAYPLIDLRRRRMGIKHLVDVIEATIIGVLQGYQVHAARHPGAPGVYVDERKIAAIGLRVTRGCTFHGLAFNLDMDMAPFQGIDPCGYRGLEVTQLADHVPDFRRADIDCAVAQGLADRLGLCATFQHSETLSRQQTA